MSSTPKREPARAPEIWGYYSEGWEIVEAARPHMRVAFLPSNMPTDRRRERGYLIAGSEDLPDDTPVRVSIGSRTITTHYLRDFRALNAAIAKAEGRT